ncbi:hypothetical protein R1flu_002607 [Riccia fluitans]|uniref:Uncharacterized protein n=1 Tax=Riccia fluitans TaxID=41844 RepID=A0ABD1Y9J4_9MARC
MPAADEHAPLYIPAGLERIRRSTEEADSNSICGRPPPGLIWFDGAAGALLAPNGRFGWDWDVMGIIVVS